MTLQDPIDAAWDAFDRAMTRKDRTAASNALRRIYGADKTDDELRVIVQGLVHRLTAGRTHVTTRIATSIPTRLGVLAAAPTAKAVAVQIGFEYPIRCRVIDTDDHGLYWAEPTDENNQPINPNGGDFAFFPGQIVAILEQ